MVTVNQGKCIACKQCESICHTKSIRVEKDKIFIDKLLCSTCTQCIAVCPVQALSWNNSAQYSLYNMALYSQALGLGSCVSGAGKMILSRNKRIKRLINLTANKDVQGVLFLGYPNVNFKNKVEGIKPQIQWNANKKAAEKKI